MKEHLAIVFTPNQADRQTATQFAASGFIADPAVKPGAQHVKFRFGHRTLETEQESVIEQSRMIQAVLIADEGVRHTT